MGGDWWCALCIVRVVMMRRRGAVHSSLVRWYSVLQRGTRAGGHGTAHTQLNIRPLGWDAEQTTRGSSLMFWSDMASGAQQQPQQSKST